MNMNTNAVYTFEISRPAADKTVADETVVNDPKGELTKTIIEGKLLKTLKDTDGSSRSIFVDCTLHYYFSNLTIPVVYKNELYSVPTSWIKTTGTSI